MRTDGILRIGLAALARAVGAGLIRRKLRRVALLAALAALAGLAFLAAVVAATAALWLWLSAQVGSVHAALVMAAGFLTVAVVILLIAWLAGRRPKRSGVSDSLLQWLKSQSNEHQGELVLAAVLAGLVAALAGSRSSRSKPDDA